jgi:hypothetical protein
MYSGCELGEKELKPRLGWAESGYGPIISPIFPCILVIVRIFDKSFGGARRDGFVTTSS